MEREDKNDSFAFFFTTKTGEQLSNNSLRLLISRMGKRAGLDKCHPHAYRHTIAINYLRANGDVFTLQALLEHSSLEMVRRYSTNAKIDLQRSRSAQVENMGL